MINVDRLCLAPGCMGEDQNEHIFSCQFLAVKNQKTRKDIKFDDIFSNDVNKQVIVMNVFRKQYEKRREFLVLRHERGPRGSSGLTLLWEPGDKKV